MNEETTLKVIRVDKNEYELENGEVFQFPEPLEIVPPLEEFQKIYEKWHSILNKEIDGQTNFHSTSI